MESDAEDSSNDEFLHDADENLPPLKARKVKKGYDVAFEDIFSDGEIILPPRKPFKTQATGDHQESKLDSLHDATTGPAKARGQVESTLKPTPFRWMEAEIPSTCQKRTVRRMSSKICPHRLSHCFEIEPS